MEGATDPISEEIRQVLDNGQASKNDVNTNPLNIEHFIQFSRLFQSFEYENYNPSNTTHTNV